MLLCITQTRAIIIDVSLKSSSTASYCDQLRRPYFLDPYFNCIFAGAYFMALHMYYVVRCMWQFLSNRYGHKYFRVYEWVGT